MTIIICAGVVWSCGGGGTRNCLLLLLVSCCNKSRKFCHPLAGWWCCLLLTVDDARQDRVAQQQSACAGATMTTTTAAAAGIAPPCRPTTGMVSRSSRQHQAHDQRPPAGEEQRRRDADAHSRQQDSSRITARWTWLPDASSAHEETTRKDESSAPQPSRAHTGTPRRALTTRRGRLLGGGPSAALSCVLLDARDNVEERPEDAERDNVWVLACVFVQAHRGHRCMSCSTDYAAHQTAILTTDSRFNVGRTAFRGAPSARKRRSPQTVNTDPTYCGCFTTLNGKPETWKTEGVHRQYRSGPGVRRPSDCRHRAPKGLSCRA